MSSRLDIVEIIFRILAHESPLPLDQLRQRIERELSESHSITANYHRPSSEQGDHQTIKQVIKSLIQARIVGITFNEDTLELRFVLRNSKRAQAIINRVSQLASIVKPNIKAGSNLG